jgi:hypothetical protein
MAALFAAEGPVCGLVADPPHATAARRNAHDVTTVPIRMSTLVSWSVTRRSCNACAAA